LPDTGEVIRAMHRTGTGPIPARPPGYRDSWTSPWGGASPGSAGHPGYGSAGYGQPEYGQPEYGQPGYGVRGARPPGDGDPAPGFPPRPGAPGEVAVTGAAGWPLRSQLEFGPLPGAIPCARLHARLVVREWGLAALADPVELIVSELVTNALRASPGGGGYPPAGAPQPIGLRLGSDRREVLVEVWDSSPGPPAMGQASEESETGRGLLMVQAMSRRWGYYYPAAGTLPPAAVKAVWALIGPGLD
jgi:anti-sigma regulatory factor (Ser/Thr protein kinase)